MVAIKSKGFDLAHERLVRELCTHLHNFLVLINGVICILAVLTRHNCSACLELVVVFNATRGKACKVTMVAEEGTENVIARIIGRPGKNPVSLGTMHLVQHTVQTLVQKGSAIYEMHPFGVVIEFDIISHCHCHWVRAAFFSCWTVAIDEAADWESERVCYTCGHTIMISECASSEILKLF